MKKAFFIMAILEIATCISCKQKPMEEKIASLKHGEVVRITDQKFYDQLTNTNDEDSIVIGTKKYLLKKQTATHEIKGTIMYILTAADEKFKVKLTSWNSGWIEKL